MNPTTKSLKRKPKPIVIRWSAGEPGMPVLVMIARGEAHADCYRPDADRESVYWVERIASGWGVAARFRKSWDGATQDFSDEVYDVLVDGDHCLCDCMGFLSHGQCKHVAALRKLAAEKVLRFPPRPEHVEERPALLGKAVS